MALFSIEFHRTEHYYHTEYIEADSKEQATEIANNLLESHGYEDTLLDCASYDWGENELQCVNPADDYKFASLTATEIDEYLEG